MKNIFNYIPIGALGQVVGSLVVLPIIVFLINKLYYANKYNDEAGKYYKSYIDNSYDIKVLMPDTDSKFFIKNIDKDYKTIGTFCIRVDNNYFSNPEARYIPFYSVEYKKYFIIMYFTRVYDMCRPSGMKVILTVNREDMNNPEYGTKENPVPVLKDMGVDESIRDNDKDYDKAYMDSFYRENVIGYLKYKMPKGEFKRRFKNK